MAKIRVAWSAADELSVASAFSRADPAVEFASSLRVVDPAKTTSAKTVTVAVALVLAPAPGVDC